MAIKSSKFSFVRFGSDWEQGCADIDYVLPAYINHEAAFYFEPDGDADPSTEYQVYKVNAGCEDESAELLDAPVFRLSYRAEILMTQTGNFWLHSLTYGILTHIYDYVVTEEEFLDILSADFGFLASVGEDGNFRFETYCDNDISLQVVATTEAEGLGDSVFIGYALRYGKAYVDLSGIPLGDSTECFRYKIDGTCSNLFKPITDPCYTSFITYSCKEPAFEFIYPDTPNKIRLPVYLTKPTWPKKREVYKRSSGLNELLSSSMDKIYQLVADHMPEVFHECMAIALAHDDIIIDNTNIREGIVEVLEADDYQAGWIDDDVMHNHHPIARGSAKLKVAKYSYSNSNCGTSDDPCEQVIPQPSFCDPIDGEFLLNFESPDTYQFTPDILTIFGDAFEIKVIDVETDLVVASDIGICASTGGCEYILQPFDVNLGLDPAKCYKVQIYRHCGYSIFGDPVVSEVIEKTGFGTCDAPLPDGEISVTNSNFGAFIDNVTGISGFTFDTGTPVGAGDEQSGTHGTFTAVIAVTISGTLGFNPGNITITKNGVPVDCQTVTGTGTFTTPALSFLYSDDIGVALNGGSC